MLAQDVGPRLRPMVPRKGEMSTGVGLPLPFVEGILTTRFESEVADDPRIPLPRTEIQGLWRGEVRAGRSAVHREGICTS